MKKLTRANLEKLRRDLGDAMDEGTARLLVNTQSKLSASSPVDTGRLASSWMVGHNSMDTSVASERAKDESRVEIKRYDGEITFDGEWHISNNLPYAQRAANDPGYVGKVGGGAGDWYSSIENNLARDAKRSFDSFLKKVK